MNVVHLPETGKKFISYAVYGTNIDFNDGDLMFNVSKKERDFDVTIDICRDYTGSLVMGTEDGDVYVAQLFIPAREYTETEIDNPDYHEGAEEGYMTGEKIIQREPVPFSMDRCELRLWEEV